MVNDKRIGAYESNSDKQKRVEADIRFTDENTAVEVQERMRKIDLEIDDGWVYVQGQRVPKGVYDSEKRVANSKIAFENTLYALDQFKEIVQSGDYKKMMSPEYQVNYVLGLLNKTPDFFGSEIATCQDILKNYGK